MSIAMKFGDSSDTNSVSGFIYFDAITEFNKTRSGKVTEFPIDAGASITDHYIAENPKYTLAGVISSADISGVPVGILVDNEYPFNTNSTPDEVVVSDVASGLSQYLPDVVSQFLSVTTNTVTVDSTSRTDYNPQVDSIIKALMNGLVYSDKDKKLKNRMTPITLYSFDGNKLVVEASSLIMTQYETKETPDSGEALVVSCSFEEIRKVTLEKAELPKDVSAALKKSATTTKKKAKVAETPKDYIGADVADKPKLSPDEALKELREANNKKIGGS